MSSYKKYVDEIVDKFGGAGWLKGLVRELIRELWDNNITVDYLMYSASGTVGNTVIVVMCYDEDDDGTNLMATAEWKYVQSRLPPGRWVLDSVEVTDEVPNGWKRSD